MKCKKNIDRGNHDDNDHATYFFFKVCIKKYKNKGGKLKHARYFGIFQHSILKKGGVPSVRKYLWLNSK
jgi:hypothetical protein